MKLLELGDVELVDRDTDPLASEGTTIRGAVIEASPEELRGIAHLLHEEVKLLAVIRPTEPMTPLPMDNLWSDEDDDDTPWSGREEQAARDLWVGPERSGFDVQAKLPELIEVVEGLAHKVPPGHWLWDLHAALQAITHRTYHLDPLS